MTTHPHQRTTTPETPPHPAHNKSHSQILTAQVNGLLPHTAYQIAQMIGAETDPDNTEFNRIKTWW